MPCKKTVRPSAKCIIVRNRSEQDRANLFCMMFLLLYSYRLFMARNKIVIHPYRPAAHARCTSKYIFIILLK